MCLTLVRDRTTGIDRGSLCVTDDTSKWPARSLIEDNPKKTTSRGKWRVYGPLNDNYKVPAIPGYEEDFITMYVNDASGFKCLTVREAGKPLMISQCDKNNPAQYWITTL